MRDSCETRPEFIGSRNLYNAGSIADWSSTTASTLYTETREQSRRGASSSCGRSSFIGLALRLHIPKLKYFLPYLLFEANLDKSHYLSNWTAMIDEVYGGHTCEDYAVDLFQELGYSSNSQKLTG
jgi:hypothetical protein